MAEETRPNALADRLVARAQRAITRGDARAARRHLEAALNHAPGHLEASGELADLERKEGDLQAARQRLRLLLGMDPPGVWQAIALLRLAAIAVEEGGFDEATTLCHQALALPMEERYAGERSHIHGEAWCWLGIVEQERGDLRAAGRLYAEALRHDPDNVTALANMALCYAELGEMRRAMDALGRAIELEPDRADLAAEMAELHQQTGATHLARLWFQRAAGLGDPDAQTAADALPPDTAEQWYETATRYEDAGDVERAAGGYERAAALGHAEAARALARLPAVPAPDTDRAP